MVHCHDMKEGQVWACESCGLELTVTKECTECGPDEDSCGPCTFECCGGGLKLTEE
jgi:hypothetical protein